MQSPASVRQLKQVPLRALHEKAGAKFVPFAGYEMPLQFSGILAEHKAVRTGCGIFDVSHMSNLNVPLDDAVPLSRAVGADVRRLGEGRAKYTVALNPSGAILDDLIVFRLPDRFHVIPNAGMNEVVALHLRSQGCRVADVTGVTCIIAVQGPRAPEIVEQALGADALEKRFRCHNLADTGFVSGTGYTGEPGVEFIVPEEKGRTIWAAVTGAGALPIGLGARDTLRLEKAYCLAGNEFDPPVTPVEANLLWTVDLDHEFVGRDAVLARKATATHRLVGVKLTGKGIPRRDCVVRAGGEPVGRVSSGTMSPTLGEGIALAYVSMDHATPGTQVTVEVRGNELAARVTEVPFV